MLVIMIACYDLIAQDPKAGFDQLITDWEWHASKWPHPTTNTSTPITPCGEGRNNAGSLVISGFDPIKRVVRVDYPYGTNYSSGQYTAVPWGDIGSTNGINKEYIIRYDHEHGQFPDRNNQGSSGNEVEFFEFEFNITNNTNASNLHYIIFYQNESYYYSENGWNMLLSGDNYYGSWGHDEKANPGLRQLTAPIGQTITIRNIFKIRGNSRNEDIYCPDNPGCQPNNCCWSDDPTNDAHMQRWARRPRVGKYRFLLVVTSDPNSITLPFLKNVQVTYNDKYYSPFYWRNCLNSNYTLSTAVAEACYHLRVYARPDLNSTLQPFTGQSSPFTNASFNTWHNPPLMVKQLPIVQDIETFTQLDYNFNKQFSAEEDFVWVRANYFDERNIDWANGDKGNAYSDGNNKLLIVSPPSNCETGTFIREHAGVDYIPQKYGKFTVKVLFPRMYTDNNMWKGLWNITWLDKAFGTGDPWGAIPCGSTNLWHTEVDIEHFPHSNSYPYYNGNGDQNDPQKQYHISQWDDKGLENAGIVIQYSLYDMMCANVVNPIPPLGHIYVTYQGDTFTVKRDDDDPNSNGDQDGGVHSYKGHDPNPDIYDYISDAIRFGIPMYYQFEWTPSEMIFRIGTSLSTLEVVSYYNGNFCRIPKEYMTWIIALFSPASDQEDDYYTGSHITKYLPLRTQPEMAQILEVIVE